MEKLKKQAWKIGEQCLSDNFKNCFSYLFYVKNLFLVLVQGDKLFSINFFVFFYSLTIYRLLGNRHYGFWQLCEGHSLSKDIVRKLFGNRLII